MNIEIRKRTPEELEEKLIELNNEIALLKYDNKVLKEQLKDENNYHEEASKWYKEAFKQIKNWNELKNFVKTEYYDGCIYSSTIIKKMQEIEGGVDNENN